LGITAFERGICKNAAFANIKTQHLALQLRTQQNQLRFIQKDKGRNNE